MSGILFILWNALLLVRRPMQIIMQLFALVSFGAGIGCLVVTFTGYGDFDLEGMPIWVNMIAPALCFGFAYLWFITCYLYDSLLFKLTPTGRKLTLFD